MESGGVGGEIRRGESLGDNKSDSVNLRDFLRVKEEDNGRDALAGLTLGAVLDNDRPARIQSNQTLQDIIRDDSNGSKKSWKSFKDKLLLRRAGSAWTSTVRIPASDFPIQNSNRMITRRQSTRFPSTNAHNSDDLTLQLAQPELSSSYSTASVTNGGYNQSEMSSARSSRAMMLRSNSSLLPARQAGRFVNSDLAEQQELVPLTEEAAAVGEAEEGMVVRAESMDEAEAGGEPTVRMSLMSLLAETDRQMGLDGSNYMMVDEEEEEGEEEEEKEIKGRSAGEYNNCCVCMVRHKGAAFIPCGHTFCRLCSRELWVQRGSCPLCNNYILEILDIF